jgi:hypothetical protein
LGQCQWRGQLICFNQALVASEGGHFTFEIFMLLLIFLNYYEIQGVPSWYLLVIMVKKNLKQDVSEVLHSLRPGHCKDNWQLTTTLRTGYFMNTSSSGVFPYTKSARRGDVV